MTKKWKTNNLNLLNTWSDLDLTLATTPLALVTLVTLARKTNVGLLQYDRRDQQKQRAVHYWSQSFRLSALKDHQEQCTYCITCTCLQTIVSTKQLQGLLRISIMTDTAYVATMMEQTLSSFEDQVRLLRAAEEQVQPVSQSGDRCRWPAPVWHSRTEVAILD